MSEVPTIVSFGWTGENREIKVVEKDGRWMTEHLVDGQPDGHLIKLHGTNVIPTPWTSDADRDTVVSELAVRNPRSNIT